MIAQEPDATRVRIATSADEDELMHLCRANHAENGIGAFAEDKVHAVFRRAFDPGRNDIGVIGVVGTDVIEGSIGLVVDQPWDGDTPILMGLWTYVLPAFRQSTHMRDLVAFARRLSDPAPIGMGLPLWMGAISHRRTEAQVRLYKRQLGEPVSFGWLCENNWSAP